MTSAALFALELVFVSSIIVVLHSLRARLGLAPLYVFVGSTQYLQGLLAQAVYFPLVGRHQASPGSVVLFASSLAAVLLVYIREDIPSTRRLLWGVAVSNLALGTFMVLVGKHAQWVGVPWTLPVTELRLVVVGTAILVVDSVLIVIVYEFLFLRIPRLTLAGRIVGTLLIVLWLDALAFVTASFHERPDYPTILVGNVIGKAISALVSGSVVYVYLAHLQPTMREPATDLRHVFSILTYRQKYEMALAEATALSEEVGRRMEAEAQLLSAQEELRRQAITDALTGCHNRRFFDEVIQAEQERHRRYGMPLCLLFVDIDRFKAVNDALGHDVGDQVLRRMADLLRSHLRGADQVIRWGGDEFLILISCGEPEAQRKVEELKQAFAAAREAGELPPMVDLSVGLCEVPPDATDIMERIAEADQRMYVDKVDR